MSTFNPLVAPGMRRGGDTMTGFLTLFADPTNALHAATKGYVDGTFGSKLDTAATPLQHVASDVTWTSTGALGVPNGSTAQAPTAVNGLVRYNNSTSRYDFGNGAGWENYVRLNGDTLTGDLAVGQATSANARLTLNGLNTSGTRLVRWQSGGSGRWALGPNSIAESATAATTATSAVAATSGLVVVPVASAAGINAGAQVVATNVASSTYVVSVSGLNVTISAGPTGAGIANGASLQFVPNTGQDWTLIVNNDAGSTWLASPLIVPRDTGILKLQQGLNIGLATIRVPVGTAITPAFHMSANFSGTLTTSTFQRWADFVINSDTATLGSGGASGVYIGHNYSSHTGGRVALSVNLTQQPGTTSGGDQSRVAANITTIATENAGGTSSSDYNLVAGSNYAIALYARLLGPGGGAGGATNYLENVGLNMNMTVATGASTANKYFLNLSLENTDRVQGTNVDAFVVMTQQPNAPGMRMGLASGRTVGGWAHDTSVGKMWGTLRGAQLQPMKTDYGLDWRDVAFNSAGIAFPGTVLDAQGGSKIGALVTATSGNTTSLDATLIHVTNTAVASSTTAGWVVGMGLYDASGNQWLATSVDAFGNLTGVSAVPIAPAYISGSAPSNPVSVVDQSGLQTATLTLTWSTPNLITVGAGGSVDVAIGSTSALSTGATKGFARLPAISGAPTGAATNGDVAYETGAGRLWLRDGGAWKSLNQAPYVRASLTGSDQSVTSGTSTKCNFGTVELDTGGWFDGTTNFRYTPQLAGKYSIRVSIILAATTGAASSISALIKKNGTTEIARTQFQLANTNAYSNTQAVEAIVSLNGSTDYIEGWGTAQGTAGTAFKAGTNFTFIEARYIGP